MNKNRPHDKKYKTCDAKTKKGTPCQRPAGWGTNHPGDGKCKLHGGSSTGPKDKSKMKDNKNAVTTGEYESIIYEVLEDDEKELYYKISLDRLSQVNEDIRLTDIRLRRMMLRIKDLQNREYLIMTQKKGIERDRNTDLGEAENPIIQIQSIEDAITRVQSHKSRLIDLKHKLQQDLGIDKELKETRIRKLKADIVKLEGEDEEYEDDGFLEALKGEISEVWQDEDTEKD